MDLVYCQSARGGLWKMELSIQWVLAVYTDDGLLLLSLRKAPSPGCFHSPLVLSRGSVAEDHFALCVAGCVCRCMCVWRGGGVRPCAFEGRDQSCVSVPTGRHLLVLDMLCFV